MGAMAYFLIILLAIDLLRLVNLILPIFPDFLTRDLLHTKQVMALIIIGIVFLTVVGARVNAMFPRIQTLELTIHLLNSETSISHLLLQAYYRFALVGPRFRHHTKHKNAYSLSSYTPNLVHTPLVKYN